MKLFSNEGNCAALKILVAGNFSGRTVSLELVSTDDARFQAPCRLPVLELDSGDRLFSCNAAARLLWPPGSSCEVEADQWLEWESSQLQPAVLAALSLGSKVEAGVRNALSACLAELKSALGSGDWLIGKTLSVADVVLWSTLYPVVTEAKLHHDWLAGCSTVLGWFKRIQDEPHVQSAVEELKLKPGVASHQQMLSAAWFPSSLVEERRFSRLLSTASSVEGGAAKEVPVSEEELRSAAEAWENGAARRPKPKPRVEPVLPVAGERNVLVTSALPYVNNVPHLGNIIGCVLSADVFARFSRLCNHNTLYLCGTDEYGTATETKALEEGLTPQQICDKYFKIHEAIYKWFDISFDLFGRTSTPEQTKICQEMFLRLRENGFTSTESMEQLLCESCNRYLADRFVEGTCPLCGYEDARGDQCDGCGHLINATELRSPRCKLCQSSPVVRNSEQFFIELPKIEPRLTEWMSGVCNGWSSNARVIARSWLKDGLKPRCITRDLKWGIPVPLDGYRDKVFYVWFDAPIGYLSIAMKYTDKWRLWWQPQEGTKVSLYQFMAKDNVPFHSVMFPATLLGADQGYTTVSHLMATEYLNYEDGKFSKSRGTGVFGTDAQDTGISSDVWRFYLLYLRPESQDTNFSWVDLATKNNSELLNNLGNFINRALVFADKFFGGRVPEMSVGAGDLAVLALVTRELRGYMAALERAKQRDGIRHILSISRHGNQYMQASQPWALVKGSDADRARAGTVIGVCCNVVCLLGVLLQPYMPATSRLVQEQLRAPPDLMLICPEVAALLPPGHVIGKPSPLFTKIEMEQVEQLKQRFSGQQKSSPAAGNGAPTIPGATEAIAKLEAAVAQQADLVRKLKSSAAPKSEWQPQVDVLLDLKKQLETAKSVSKSKSGAAKPAVVTKAVNGVEELEAEVSKQADLVRKMKSSGVPKSEWQPYVNVLLDLKKKLAAAQNINGDVTATNNCAAHNSDAAKLEAKVAEQAERVRKMKGSGVPKSEWQPEVAVLLDLKKQLATAQGIAAAPARRK
ncbi:methionine--tRNA ligase, cytoplasmic isoform X2 [Bacillus rossius redtenbacheri]|uniref:methionine--tRNA ligase, cytoplasmic isoform X2 n=1 Tax=Bacillus rossius redtenbacheri TaxID=93214 RepID=UPI002FDEB521